MTAMKCLPARLAHAHVFPISFYDILRASADHTSTSRSRALWTRNTLRSRPTLTGIRHNSHRTTFCCRAPIPCGSTPEDVSDGKRCLEPARHRRVLSVQIVSAHAMAPGYFRTRQCPLIVLTKAPGQGLSRELRSREAAPWHGLKLEGASLGPTRLYQMILTLYIEI